MTSDRNALAIATLGILLLTVMDAMIKSLSGRFSAVEIMYFRNITGLVYGGILFMALRPGWPSRAELGHHALRSGVMMCSGLLFFHALGQLPLAELFVYAFTAPMLVALFGALLLKERLTTPVIGGIALGFSGIVAIIATDPAARFGGGSTSGLVAALLAPIFYALAAVLLRRQAGGEPAVRIVFLQSVFISIVMVPLAAFTVPMPVGIEVWKVLGLGLLGTAGNLLLAAAFRRAEAAKVAVTEYTGLIWAAILGYAFFAEVPRSMVWVGAVLVIAGCLVVARSRSVSASA